MDQMDDKQRETVYKMNTSTQFITKLVQLGHSEEELAELKRADLQTLNAREL